METLDALQYLLFFILLTNVECYNWPDHGWNCPSEEEVDDCFCKAYRDKENERLLNCGRSYTVEDYVSRLRKNQYSKNIKLDIRFLNLKKTPNEISSNTFEGLNIRSLVIERCNITKWADEDQAPAFVGLEDTLEYLKIEEYIIRPRATDREVAAFTIRHLRKLKELDLRGNRLTMFKNDWLGDGLGDSLEKVSLYNNWIWGFSDDTFANLKKLEYIDLSANRISKISRSMFPNPATYLKEMDLSGNRIRDLPKDFFENMPALIDVNFNSNEILIMDENTWRPVWSQLRNLLIYVPSLHCHDKYIEWMFKVKRPLFLSGKCYIPEELRGKHLKRIIDEKKNKSL